MFIISDLALGYISLPSKLCGLAMWIQFCHSVFHIFYGQYPFLLLLVMPFCTALSFVYILCIKLRPFVLIQSYYKQKLSFSALMDIEILLVHVHAISCDVLLSCHQLMPHQL